MSEDKHHDALRELDHLLDDARRLARKDTAKNPVPLGTLRNLRSLLSLQQDRIDGLLSVTPQPPRPRGRPTNPPIDEKPPGRLEDFAQFPPEDISGYLRGLREQLQKLTHQREKASRVIQSDWTRTRDIRRIAQLLIHASNHAGDLQQADPTKLATVLSAWGTRLIPFTDDGHEPENATFIEPDGEFFNVALVSKRLRKRYECALEQPGRALRLFAQLTDDFFAWTQVFDNEDLDEDERTVYQELEAKPSAQQLHQQFVLDAQQETSPYPEFAHLRNPSRPVSPSPGLGPPIAELSALSPPPRINTPDPGNRPIRGRADQEPAPRILTTAPTFPITRVPTPEAYGPRTEPPNRQAAIDLELGETLPDHTIHVNPRGTITDDTWQNLAETLASTAQGSVIRKKGATISGNLDEEALRAITADISSSSEGQLSPQSPTPRTRHRH